MTVQTETAPYELILANLAPVSYLFWYDSCVTTILNLTEKCRTCYVFKRNVAA